MGQKEIQRSGTVSWPVWLPAAGNHLVMLTVSTLREKGKANLCKAYRKPLNGLAPQPSAWQSLVKEAI
jgi:hypothetical protein